MEDLHLQLRYHKSRSRAWWDDTPTPTEGKPPRKKQVRFDVDEELGDDPTLSLCLTFFLEEGMAKEWDDAHSPSTPMPVDSQWLTPSKVPQCHPTYTGGVWPQVPAKPSTGWSYSQPQSRPKEGPDPVNHTTDGSMQRWRGWDALTGGKKSKPVEECPWKATL